MRLLVSVADAADAYAAVDGGADIVDAKDPTRGALGPVSPAALRAIIGAVAGRRPVSAAIGEITDGMLGARAFGAAPHCKQAGIASPPLVQGDFALSPVVHGDFASSQFVPGDIALPPFAQGEFASPPLVRGDIALPPFSHGDFASLQFVKVAFAPGMSATAAAKRAAEMIDVGTVRCVLAAYADAGLHRDDVVEIAAQIGASGVLLDTFDKTGPGLFDVVDDDTLARWVRGAQRAGLTVALAGRLSAAELPRVAALGADIVGVRGAACVGGREAQVSPAAVRALRATIQRETAPMPDCRAAAST